MGCHCILDMEGAKTTIVDPKVGNHLQHNHFSAHSVCACARACVCVCVCACIVLSAVEIAAVWMTAQ